MARVALVAGAATLLALLAVLAWRATPASPEARIAGGLEGTRWYSVTLRDVPIGHYQAINGRTADGDYEFRSVLRVQLSGTLETRTDAKLVFHRRPPHLLVRAEQTTATNGVRSTRVTIGDGEAQVVEDGRRQTMAMNDRLPLADYLAVEGWLATTPPAPGDTRSARSVDFDRLALVTNRWRIVAGGNPGIAIVNDSAQDATRIQMDSDFVPERVEFGDEFALQRVANERAARVWQKHPPLFANAARRIPMDGVIADPTALRHLVVAVDWAADGTGKEDARLLTAVADQRTPASADELTRASAATVRYPASDPRLRDLSRRAVAGLTEGVDKANALTLFVHNHLRYQDAEALRTVHDTVRDRRGDCTEFAELFTTLARAAGLPARTVIGFAYQPEEGAFALHAWNEVAVDAVWRGVDPTWGQIRLDATHLALPAGESLATLVDLSDLRLRVVETRY